MSARHPDGEAGASVLLGLGDEAKGVLLDWLGAIEDPRKVCAVKVRRGSLQLLIAAPGKRSAWSRTWRRYAEAPLPPLDVWRSALDAMAGPS